MGERSEPRCCVDHAGDAMLTLSAFTGHQNTLGLRFEISTKARVNTADVIMNTIVLEEE